MSGLGVIIAGVIAFTLIVLALVAVILGAKATLVPSGNVTIEINGDSEKTLSVPTGGKLINTLAEKNIFIPSACGGGGTCGQCKVRVLSGGGEILPTEASVMTRKEIKNHVRLACQTPVKQDMKIEIPPEIFSVKKWECTVLSNESVATFIKELVLELPEGESVDFKAGGYVQVERPAGLRIKMSDYDIPETYRQDWIDMKLWDRESYVAAPISRAYSMASHPGEKKELTQFCGIEMANTRKIKALLLFLAENVPYEVNIAKLSTYLELNKQTVLSYLNSLQRAELLHLLYSDNNSVTRLQKPDKIYLHNPNLFFAFGQQNQIGTIRECFVVNQLSVGHGVEYGKQQGDFRIDGRITIEVGGHDKTFDQIADIPNSYVLADMMEYPIGKKLPLWLVGMLY